jgi:hypothetical protein
MSLNIRRLVAMSVAVVGITSASASPAAAATVHDFTTDFSTGGSTIFTGAALKKQAFFKFSGGAEVICEASSLAGTAAEAPKASLTLQPTFSGCVLGGQAATLDTPCSNIYTGETTQLGYGTVHIECAVEPVKITVNGCTIQIASQTPSLGAKYTTTKNKEGMTDVDITVEETSTTYEKSGFLCSLITGLTGELSIVGEYTVSAYEDINKVEGKQKNFWIVTTN